MAHEPPPPEECAHCGAAIPRNTRACPECGADERTGWRETSVDDGLDLPDAAYASESKHPAEPTRCRHPLKWYWLAAGLFLLVWLVLGALALS
jgi:predicted nucleic acid-binding Zn ribbon protein